jgi:hypothetical protein
MKIKSELSIVSEVPLEKAVAEELKVKDPKKDLIEGIIHENTKGNDRDRGCCCNREDCKKTST